MNIEMMRRRCLSAASMLVIFGGVARGESSAGREDAVSGGTARRLAMAGGSCVDDFEGGVNDSGWTFGVTTPDILESSGGNPGWWLHNNNVNSFAPILRSPFGADLPLTGDLRAKGVTAISIDAQTLFASFGVEGFEFSLLLRDMNGTPADPDDDDYAYFVGPFDPQPGEGWVHYEFEIPSQSTDAVPPGWSGGWAGDPENFRPGVEWSDVIIDVERVEFWWLNPAFFAIFQQFDVGVDNISVTSDECGAACVGDLDGDDMVDSADLALLLGDWGPCLICSEADINGDQQVNSADLALLLGGWGPC